MKRATLVATVTTRPSSDGSELAGLPREVNWLELRADLAGDVTLQSPHLGITLAKAGNVSVGSKESVGP